MKRFAVNKKKQAKEYFLAAHLEEIEKKKIKLVNLKVTSNVPNALQPPNIEDDGNQGGPSQEWSASKNLI